MKIDAMVSSVVACFFARDLCENRYPLFEDHALWSQSVAIRANIMAAIRSGEWRLDKIGRKPGPFMKEIGTRGTSQSWACAITPRGCAHRCSTALARSNACHRISTCIVRG